MMKMMMMMMMTMMMTRMMKMMTMMLMRNTAKGLLREETHKACDEISLGGHGTGHSEPSGDIWIRKESTPRCPRLLIT